MLQADKQKTYDAVIVGGGHNGLVCACYLAAAGLSVKILERRSVVGGAAVTEEFHPGFRNSTAAYTVSLLNPKVIRDLDLPGQGLRIVERRLANFFPRPDGGHFKLPVDLEALQAVSATDAEALPRYYAMLERMADLLRDLVLETPPNAGGGLVDLFRAAKLGNRLRKLTLEEQRDFLALFTQSVGDFLDGWFESDDLKGALGFDGTVGFYGGPYMPGSAYIMLHHAFGEVNGKKGVWGHAIGGMGAITQAMARTAQARGVEIELDAAVAQVVVEDGRAVAVRLGDGAMVRGQAIISNLNPKLLYGSLIDEAALDADFRRRMAGWKCGSGTLRMNVALSELPDFSALPGTNLQDHHTAGIVIGHSLAYFDQAYRDAVEHGWSRAPIIEMLIPSTLDDTLAPSGCHVASLFCQQFAPTLPEGRSWDDAREQAADLIIDTINAHAPNFKASVIARQIHSPLDLERKFGLLGGDIFHGALSLDQMFSARPMLGHGDYRGPLKGLYMRGAGTHPGGGVTGAPGHNAAREIIKDFRRGKV